MSPNKKRISRKKEQNTAFKSHESKKWFMYILIAVILVPLLLLASWSWKFQKGKAGDGSWSRLVEELSSGWQEIESKVKNNQEENKNSDTSQEKEIIQNPQNLSQDEVENLEQKAFGASL